MSAVSTSTTSGPGSESIETASTVTETANATTSSFHVTDEPDTQTSNPHNSATITSTVSGQSARSSIPASSGDDSEPSASASDNDPPAPTVAASSESSSSPGEYSSYLSSLNAENLLENIRSTLKWLVSDKKVHARALAY
ncbi:hypothetical protein PDIDSM_467 [Penicillium digitatum]|nr:hypothetical protein PDIDSM_467 [Penicillium digitatum]